MIVTGKIPVSRVISDSRRQFLIITLFAWTAIGLHIAGKRDSLPSWLTEADRELFAIPISALASLGVALGIFLSLRNNIVWSRYWEARSLWGRLINVSRTIPRQLDTFLHPPKNAPAVAEMERDAIYQDVLRRHIAFVKTFRDHLRDENPQEKIAEYLPAQEAAPLQGALNIPSAVHHSMGEKLSQAWERGFINDYHLPALDASMTELSDILGGCEKIKNTPLPPAYTYLAHRIVLYYCCLLPFGLVHDVEWIAFPLTLIFSFAFLTLDQISELIENPFSRDDNDLPLDTITRNIEREVLQRMGAKELPPKLQPIDGVSL